MPANRAGIEFVRTYYASGDRASRPTGGSRETVGAITRDDVVAFHEAQVVAHGATLVLAGDLSGVDAFGIVERALGGWAAGADERATHLSVPAEVAADRGRVVIVDRPGSVQSEILIGCPGPDRSVEGGWAPYPVIGFVLGGSPNARIDAVLREEKGYTYGIRSSFRPRRSGGLFMTSGSVRAETTAESLGLLVDLLESGSKGFSDKEVRSGVDFIGKTAPGRYATADAIADEAEMMALDGRTTEFTTANLRDLATVDAARLQQAWARFAERSGIGTSTGAGRGWTVVVVGDAATFRDEVDALGLGPIEVTAGD